MESKIEKYAELLLKKGLQIEREEPLIIVGPIERIDFIRILSKKAYEMGVYDIDFIFEDSKLKREQLLALSKEQIATSPLFDRTKIENCANKGGSVIFLEGADPDAMSDVPADKLDIIARASVRTQPTARRKRSKYEMPWVIAAVPTENWAKKVYPNDKNATEKLWESIFTCCLINETDPISAWDNKIKKSENIRNRLNEMNLKKLHYTNKLGTDLWVELPTNSIWEGACSKMPNKERYLLVNIPTEEIFTSPHYKGTNGIVYSSKPLVYGGNVIDQFYIEFKEGKVINYHAEKGEEILKNIIELDENSKYLGEIALVEYDSPISNSKVLFYTTLYDENASCHLALGDGFPLTIEGGAHLNKEELLKRGINQSDIHVDFMIGTADLQITGIDEKGKEHLVFTNGNFAFK